MQFPVNYISVSLITNMKNLWIIISYLSASSYLYEATRGKIKNKIFFMVYITNRSSSFPTIAFLDALFTKNIAKYRFAMVL